MHDGSDPGEDSGPAGEAVPATGPGAPGAGEEAGDGAALLRARLVAAGRELAERAGALEARRQEVFGGGELVLAGADSVPTARPAVPADLAPVGPCALFASNPAEVTDPADVFRLLPVAAVGRPDGDADSDANGDADAGGRPTGGSAGAARDARADEAAGPDVPGLLDDAEFLRDFRELYRYYRDTRVLRLRVEEDRLLAVFRTGAEPSDVPVLSWKAERDGSYRYQGTSREAPPAGAVHEIGRIPVDRDRHVPGRRPHIALTAEDGGRVTLRTTGGTLRVATGESGRETVHEEPVEDALQSLADADVAYAAVGPLVLLRVRPYREDADRHFVVNTRTATIDRADALARTCLPLPDGQGVVFPGGYALAAGGLRTFDLGPEVPAEQLEFERLVRSPGGEDVLYVFHAAADGRRLLLPYRTISQEAAAPLHVQGCALFDDGTLLTLRPADGGEPARVHTVQRWHTPYLADTFAPAAGDGPLQRIGNPDLVRAVSDALSLARAAREPAPTAAAYEALAAAADRVLDRHHWLTGPEAGGLAGPLERARHTARQMVAAHARAGELTARAAAAADEVEARIAGLGRRVRGEATASADEWVARLTELRAAQGRLASLREMRYADPARLDALGAGLGGHLAEAAGRAAACLAEEHAFDGYRQRVAETAAAAGAIATAAAAGPVAERLAEQAAGLATVTETVAGLGLADATVRTRILDLASAVLAEVNQARALLDARRRELTAAESDAEFAAQSALLAQEVSGALAAAATPEACDEQLGRLLVRVENLTTRFTADPERLAALDVRRDEIQQAFSGRRQALADERALRVRQLTGSAARVLDGVRRRAAAADSLDALNTYLAADPMAAEHRRIADRLRAMGEPSRAAELDAALAAARQDAGRALRDRLDLYEDGGATLRLGRHRFPVNPHPFALALVPHGDGLAFTVSATDYLVPVTDPEFAATRRFWDRPLPSETPELYRAEYLAACLLLDAQAAARPLPQDADEAERLVREAVAARPGEGYERGVHDHDAALILAALSRLAAGAGLLRHPAAVRAAAQLFWVHGVPAAARAGWTTRARSLTRAAASFGGGPALAELAREIGAAAADFLEPRGLGPARAALGPDAHPVGEEPADGRLVGEYLVAELADERPGFAEGPGARELRERLTAALGGPEGVPFKELAADLEALGADPAAGRQLAEAWLAGLGGEPGDRAEAAAVLVCGAAADHYPVDAPVEARVDGLLGAHPRTAGRRLTLRLDELLPRVRRFRAEEVPAYAAYQRHRTAVLEAERRRLDLDAHRPRPLTGFVRNRLLDEVYLPLVGDSLAKQFGPSGGLLMLMSPPGYGKTSLVEYVASRLGLALVQVSGPALGSGVTSLDPAAAPDAAARREVEKIDLALRLGSNVLLYLDDIQHTSPELLQKFIPLCDAQRRIEGAHGTYDLRGRRFAVCMAGNPYTGSGTVFRVPDMLANRADVWNLGDVLSGREDLFAFSYVENALTANPVLAPLAGRDRADLELLVRLAEGDPTARPEDLRHPCPAADRAEITAVLRHLLRARRTLLAVNAAYIASAAQSPRTRTEPPFLLQGSYRTMTAIAARIVPAMDDAELDALVGDHYRAEAQTLAAGAEASLLKLAELRGALTGRQAARWAALKEETVRTATG
ncbi:DNA repair ATPase [Actinacidiphila acidipaludis]|uniref:DNA repair ATPase n=1 Tax=Actinacidiphila acidipaludis TaxID=2873382 RepID=A0ABS7Q6Y5_9ACTN|nr:DNA repair ATPase [Streptomyces acidipaludis]MBY8878920.1 DNA repair ATPase [Streptomyces acidipaludis]